jgi:hypothetical protein
MSRLISSCLALGLVAALAAPVPIIGQQTDQELVSKLDSLVPLLPQARKAASDARERQAREREAANGTLDTIMVGPLRVLVFPGQADVARDVMGSVWDRDFAGWPLP